MASALPLAMQRTRVRPPARSRVAAISSPERNYHIFYHILEGASKEERALYKIGESNNEYAYTQGEAKSAGIDDKASWAEAKRQLELLGFSQVLITDPS